MKKYCLSLICAIAVIGLISCKKEIDEIGLDLQDESLLNAEFVEVPLKAYAIREDSIYTKNLLNNLVGYINDPVFGKTQAGFCSQFILSGNNINFGGNPITIDSVVLTLQCSGYFGDTMSPLRMEVYKLSEKLSETSYYSNHTPAITGTNLVYNNTPIYPQPTTNVYVDSANSAAHLRIRLTNEFGHHLMTECNLSNNVNFQDDFYGLAVKAELINPAQTGNLCYVSLTSSLSGISVYYTLDNAHKKYTFPISSACTRYNFFEHDYATASSDLRRQIFNFEQQLGEHNLYLQATGGIKTHVTLPELPSELINHNVVINKAELVITNISEDEATLFNPYNLGLQVVNNDNTLSYTPDDATYTSTDYFGGIYDSDKKEYRFRITKYVQKVVTNTKNNIVSDKGLNIVVNGAGVRGNRLIFRGTNSSYTDRLRLDVYYTTY